MSSSSSAIERLIRRAVGILESENPLHTRLFHEALGPLAIVLEVGPETLRLSSSEGALSIAHASHGDVHVRTTMALVPSLVRGEVSVVEAVRAGRLEIHGKAPMLDRAAHAIEVFLHGILRCPSGKELMTDLQAATRAEAT